MKQRSPKQYFELFFSSRSPIYFLLGALALAVAGNMLSDLAKHYFAPQDEAGRLWLILIGSLAGLGGLVLLAFSAGVIRRRLDEPFVYRVIDFSKPIKARGLIGFVSTNESAHLKKALEYHGDQLERVWLIASDDAEDMAEQIKQEFESAQCRIKVIPLGNPFEPLHTKQAIELIYNSQLEGLTEADVVADFTGGTKPMSAGMIFACLSPQRRLQYIPVKIESGKKLSLDPVEFVFDYMTVGSTALPALSPNDSK